MTWRTFIKSAWILPFLLATMCFLAGCQSIPTTRTAETERDIVAGGVLGVEARDLFQQGHPGDATAGEGE